MPSRPSASSSESRDLLDAPLRSDPALADATIDAVSYRIALDAVLPLAVATSAAAIALAWVLSGEIPVARLAVWLAVVHVWTAGRVALFVWLKWRARGPEEIQRALTFFAILMAGAAATWGVLIVVAGLSTELSVITPVLLVIGGMMATGSSALASIPRLWGMSVLLSLAPICLHMLLSGDSTLRALLIPTAGYVGTMILAIRVNHQQARTSIALRFENRELVRALTAEKNREEAARHAAERANVEKSRFLAAASHDVRQPLHALGLFVDALKSLPLTEEAARVVSSIELAHGSLASLHEGLLDVSRLDAGVVAPVRRAVRARGLVERLEAEAAPRADELGLRFSAVCRDLTLDVDPELLLRLLRNLVANALTYTQQGGVLLAVRRRGEHALIQVWDTGIGIPEEERERIFDELHQVGNRARDREQGLGLGLAIVRRLAELLDTEVTLRSTVGQGSVFQLRVPLSKGASSEAGPFEDGSLHGELASSFEPLVAAGSVALVVDDDPLARAALARTLERWGYEVVAAQSAAEAEEYARALPRVDLLVSDLWLPDRSGLSLALSLERPTLWRVITSGDTDPHAARSVREAGVVFLQKPVRAAQLRIATRAPWLEPLSLPPSDAVELASKPHPS
jgi:two-component system, sensor histidine kinase